MADADVDDICRVLAVCFRHGNSLSELDIERILSFDMGWLSPDEASTAVHALIDSGWLIGNEDSLQPMVKNNSITTPLGWFPRPSRLINPVKYDSLQFSESSNEENIQPPKQTKKIEESVKNKTSNLPFLKSDTNNVIEFNDSFAEEIKNDKPRSFWELLKVK